MITPTLLCEKDTADSQQDQDQEGTVHGPLLAIDTDTRGGFLPPGAADAKSNISAGESHPGLAGPQPHGVAWQA